jgi:hypothetical protein
VADALRPRRAAPRQADEESERNVREDVQQRVVADEARRGAEEEERRAGWRGEPRRKRLERRVDDREPVERRENVRQARAF